MEGVFGSLDARIIEAVLLAAVLLVVAALVVTSVMDVRRGKPKDDAPDHDRQ